MKRTVLHFFGQASYNSFVSLEDICLQVSVALLVTTSTQPSGDRIFSSTINEVFSMKQSKMKLFLIPASTLALPAFYPPPGFGLFNPIQVKPQRADSETQPTNYYGDYNAYLATDGQLSPGNSGFYHSNLEPYPALRIALKVHMTIVFFCLLLN